MSKKTLTRQLGLGILNLVETHHYLDMNVLGDLLPLVIITNDLKAKMPLKVLGTCVLT